MPQPNAATPISQSPTPAPVSKATAAREVELKLHVAPADLARIVALPVVTGLADGAARVRRLRTVYYDTPDLWLYAHGVALRVRREAGPEGDRFIQTLKTVNSATASDSAGVAVRREWDWPVAGEGLDLSILSSETIAGLVPSEIRGALAPLFVTDMRRTTLILRPDPLTAIELAADDGVVEAAGRTQPISEIELELKAGRVARLFDVGMLLQQAVPMRIGTESKAEIGLRMVTGRPPAPADSPPLSLSPLTTVAEAYRHIQRHALRQFLANEACALAGGDVEGLHRMRVALRRLRTAHRLFSPLIASAQADRLVADSRALAKRLGPARGWDVTLADVIAPLSASAKAPPGLPALAAAARSAGSGPARDAVAAILAPSCTAMVLALAAWLEDGAWLTNPDGSRHAALDAPITSVAAGWLTARHGKIGKAPKLPEDAPGWDKLRRRLRALRYTVEFFRGLYPDGATQPFVQALEDLLLAFDTDHDAATSRKMLSALPGVDRKTLAATVAWIDRRAEKRRRALPDLWTRFLATPPFWG